MKPADSERIGGLFRFWKKRQVKNLRGVGMQHSKSVVKDVVFGSSNTTSPARGILAISR
jgi:hypothetical protein